MRTKPLSNDEAWFDLYNGLFVFENFKSRRHQMLDKEFCMIVAHQVYLCVCII